MIVTNIGSYYWVDTTEGAYTLFAPMSMLVFQPRLSMNICCSIVSSHELTGTAFGLGWPKMH